MERLTFRHDCPYNDFHGRAEPCEPINCLDEYSKKALDEVAGRLAAYEDTGLEPEEYKAYKSAIERQGAFGRLFLDYVGCPRGAVGRMGSVGNCAIPGFELLAAEVLHQPSITDVDGGRWIPVNADALIELVSEYKAIRALGTVEELSALVKARDEGRVVVLEDVTGASGKHYHGNV